VTEAVPTGWDLDNVVCTGGDSDLISNGVSVHLDPGETIVCLRITTTFSKTL
jgi:hypothetical protein